MKHMTHRALGWSVAAVLTVALAPANADEATARAMAVAASNTAAAQPRKLDLRAPALERVFTPAQLADMTRPRDEYEEALSVQSVKVQTDRDEPVYVPSGFAGIGWAVRNPSQAWRLFVPAPSE